jgi:hypothetical protein
MIPDYNFFVFCDTEAGKAIGFALEQSFRVATLAVFRFMDFKTASAE